MGEVVNLDLYRKRARTRAGRGAVPATPGPQGGPPARAAGPATGDRPECDDAGAGDGAPPAPGGPDTAAAD